MKKWKVQVEGTTTVEVEADNYDEALNKIKEKTIQDKKNLDWDNLNINKKTIEVTDEKN